MNTEIFNPKTYTRPLESGAVSVESSSNIALVKYWGKKEGQIPTNPSISFTLKNCNTQTEVHFQKKSSDGFSVEVSLDGEVKEKYSEKIITFFERIEDYVPFLKDYQFKIKTRNSFPHSSGIASSASGMSAMAKAILEIEKEMGAIYDVDEYHKKASFFARLGSGSAARSVYPGYTLWGETKAVKGSSDEYAVDINASVDPIFLSICDTILLIDTGEKKVTSTLGHKLMNNHPFGDTRTEIANQHTEQLLDILKKGDIKGFGRLVEQEALMLHGLMMTSNPAYILMRPNTLAAIEKIWHYRGLTQKNVFFTLDAGANIHLLYFKQDFDEIQAFIEESLAPLCVNGNYINDEVLLG